MQRRIRNAVRKYHTITAIGLALYAVNCFDTSAQIGAIPYLNSVIPHASQVLGTSFVVAACLMLNYENPIKMRHYVLLILPQIIYSAVTVQWFLSSDIGLNLGALWLHPFVSALLLGFSWIIPEIIAALNIAAEEMKAARNGMANPPTD